MSDSLAELQNRLGYQFEDLSLLQLAITHRSASRSHNERFEFLGDALLGFLVADSLFGQYPEAAEGELTRSRAALVNKPALAQLAKRWNLGEVIRLGSGERKSGGGSRDSILADAVEAIIAAIYLDGGLDAAREFLSVWSADLGKTEALPAMSGKDAKTELQEWLQARSFALPDYQVVSVEGPAHAQTFRVTCSIALGQRKRTGNEQRTALDAWEGEGMSKRSAEQAAAGKALAALAVIGSDTPQNKESIKHD